MRPDCDISVDLRVEPLYGARMLNPGKGQSGKLRSYLYLCCAVILFVVGIWLLVEPVRSHGQSLRDNVVAGSGFRR
jgi:hypothetical protein